MNTQTIVSRIQVSEQARMAELAAALSQGTPAQVQPGASKEDRAAHRGSLCDAWRCGANQGHADSPEGPDLDGDGCHRARGRVARCRLPLGTSFEVLP